MGEGKGIHPGRVVWVHDPKATDWRGPGDGHWWEPAHTNQKEVDAMVSRAIRELAGATADAAAWDKLFRHFNKSRGRGDAAYKSGEKIAVKVNFVGMIQGGRGVNPETYDLDQRQDYMNTSPQVILALLRQLVRVAGVKEADISVGDSTAYFGNPYYQPLHDEFPGVRYVDCQGKAGRVKVQPSTVPFYWSCRPEGCQQDFVPDDFAEATYLINLANLKAHTGAGVTLCAKNHFGSLVRTPVEKGYYEMHHASFAKEEQVYRPQVDLMGHAHFGGKTVLYLIDGLYPGKHPIESAPRKWDLAPFNGNWAASLLASQDPVAIDSVGFDFLYAQWQDYPHQKGADDYLREAALAEDPPSGTFYDPDHPDQAKRLSSLGVHEHWNNAQEKQYSRNLGLGKGVELVPVMLNVEEGKTMTQAVRVYVGTYTRGKSKGIYLLRLDLASGALTPPELAAEAVSPSFLALHPSGRFVYAVGEGGDLAGGRTGSVSAFAIEPESGKLKLLNQQSSAGAGPCHLTVDHGGKNVLVANYGSGTVCVLPLGEDGRLAEPSEIIYHQDDLASAKPRRPHAHSVNLDATGRFAFAADLGLDRVFVYRFDPAKGKLTANDPSAAVLAVNSGPRHFASHPSGKFAYVINEMASTVTALAYDSQRGALVERQTISTLPEGFVGKSYTAEVQVHPSGRFLYGSNRGHDSIAVFAVDAETGRLSPVEHPSTQGRTPRHFGIDPTGTYLIAANQDSDSLVVFRIDPKTGKLTPTGTKVEVPAPVCVKFMLPVK